MAIKAIQEIGVDASLLMERLRKLEVGEVVSYDELGGIIKRDVRGKARGSLHTAMRRVLRDDNMVCECVRTVGVKRLDDPGIIDVGQTGVQRVHRSARRSLEKVSKVSQLDKLNNQQKIAFNTTVSMLGLLSHVTKRQQVKRLEQVVQTKQDMVPLRAALESFVEANGKK
jgi:hypothetical protein